MSGGVSPVNQGRAHVLLAVWHGSAESLDRLVTLLGREAQMIQREASTLVSQGLLQQDSAGRYLPGLDEERARRAFAELSGLRSCRVCGCTEPWACDGGCWWTADDLCSSCDEDSPDRQGWEAELQDRLRFSEPDDGPQELIGL